MLRPSAFNPAMESLVVRFHHHTFNIAAGPASGLLFNFRLDSFRAVELRFCFTGCFDLVAAFGGTLIVQRRL